MINFPLLKNLFPRAQWLRALAVIAEDMGVVPSTHMAAVNNHS